MRLEEMRDKYPGAFKIFYEWWRNTPNYKNRDLFDFFDRYNILLIVDYNPDGDYFKVHVWGDGAWYNLLPTEHDNRRPEAEESGWEKCFEILNERKNNGTEKI